MDSIIESTATRIFADHSDDADTLWAALNDSELTRAWIPQSMDGGGLSAEDIFGLIRLSGSTVQSVPFAETLLASHLLSSAGLQTPTGTGSIAVTCSIMNNQVNDTENIEVPFANKADYIVAMTGADSVSLFKSADLPCIASTGIESTGTENSGIKSVGTDPLYSLSLNNLTATSTARLPEDFTIDSFNRIGALIRSAQMCGAMDAILDLTLTHTSTREQFGRPLAKFQAIQHLLAEIAGEAAASSAIVEAAVESFGQSNQPDFRNTASAKARTSEAAGIVAANAHQAHGAIGYTQEYALSAYTRRLWRWREEFGNETQWSLALGRDYLATGAGTLTEEFLV